MTPKKATALRLSNRGVELLNALAAFYGLSQQSVIEMLVRRCYRTGCPDAERTEIRNLVTHARESSSPIPSKSLTLSEEVLDLADRIAIEHSLPGRADVVEIAIFGAADVEGLLRST